jgi:SAM-dependent methyltransferase
LLRQPAARPAHCCPVRSSNLPTDASGSAAGTWRLVDPERRGYDLGVDLRHRYLYELGASAYAWCTAQAGWRASCAALAAHLPPAPLRLLDLGCGPGEVLGAAALARPGAALYGVDLASRMLAAARRRGIAATGARLVHADAARLPFAAAAFDAVSSHSFLYLVPDRAVVVDEAWRVLRPRGRLLLMEPRSGPVRWRTALQHSRDPRFLVSVVLWRAFNRFQGRFQARALAALLTGRGFLRPRGVVVLGGLGLLVRADKPDAAGAVPPARTPSRRQHRSPKPAPGSR